MAQVFIPLGKGSGRTIDFPDNDPMLAAIYNGMANATQQATSPRGYTSTLPRPFAAPYPEQIGQLLKAYAPILGLNQNSDWAGLFSNAAARQNWDWSQFDNPSQTFEKIITWNNLPNNQQVKTYLESTPEFKAENQSFASAWQESNKSSGSFFSDILPIASIAVAFAFPELAGYIGESLGFGEAASAEAIAAGNAAMKSGIAAVQGKSIQDIIKAGAVGAIAGEAGREASAAAGGGAAGAAVGGAASGATSAALTGGDILGAAKQGAAVGGISGTVKDITTTPGQVDTTSTREVPSVGPVPEVAPQPATPPTQIEPGQELLYDPSGKPLSAEEVAAKNPDLYPGGNVPKAGEETTYTPSKPGVSGAGSFLSQILSLGGAPGGAPYKGDTGRESALLSGLGVSTSPSAALGGDIESTRTGGKRKDVWNVASLKNIEQEV